MTAAVNIKVNGSTAVRRELNDVSERLDKRRIEMAKIETPLSRAATFLDRWVQVNFRTEGGNVGGWLPFARGGRLLPNGSIDGSAKLLQDTGRLRASFLPFASKKDAGIVSDLPYAPIHHEGQGVPERRMLPKAREVVKDITKILEEFVEKVVR